ncbi:MAG: radical SAM protein [Candidatus Omnitrophica bacterium]|nr:radical SAM protein [Candidatus Omnitrophota bacterium]
MRGNKCVFIFFQQDGSSQYHLGASYIVAYLKKNGINASQFICSNQLSVSELTDRILDLRPVFAGFTCFDANYFLVKKITSAIKQKTPTVLTLAGGPTATFSDMNIMQDTKALDFCVRGEGELTVLELLSQGARKNLSKIKGITYRLNNKIIRNPGRPLIKNLDAIPSPYLSGVLDPADVLRVNSEIPLLTSRGCIFNCSYCNFAAMSRHTIRYHSTRRIIREFQLISSKIHDYHHRKIAIQDDIFTFNKTRVSRICDKISAHKLKLRFSFLTRPDFIDEGILKELHAAGFEHIKFGLESASVDVLFNIKKIKGQALEKTGIFTAEKNFIGKVKKITYSAKKLGFHVNISVIFGLPGDTYEKAIKTINFLRELNPTTYVHNFLNIFSGTQIAKEHLQWGIRIPPFKFKQVVSDPVLNPVNYAYNVYKIPRLNNDLESLNFFNATGQVFLRNMTGIYGGTENRKRNIDVVVAAKKFPVQWMENNLALGSSFIFGKNVEILLSGRRTGHLSLLVNTASFLHPRYSCLSVAGLENRVLDSFKRSLNFKHLADYSSVDSGCIYKIADNQDMLALKNQLVLFKKGKNKNIIILDSCRWHRKCPLSNLSRLVLGESGKVCTCFSGTVVGRTAQGVEVLSSRISALMQKIQAERGCKYCPANNVCSKCISLDKITAKEYCRARKSLGTEEYVESLFFTNQLILTKGNVW